MSTRELDRTLFSGIAWTASLRWLGQIVSWSATLYAARVLTPGDYGLAALAMIPIGFARLIENFGLEAVVLQDRSLSSDQIARLAGVGVLLAVFLMGAFVLAAPLFAAYFHEDVLHAMTIVLSVTFLIDALQIVPRALLQRDLEFQKLAIVSFVQTVVGALTLVLLAKAAFGAWSLIFNTLISALVVLVIMLRLRPYALAMPRRIGTLLRPLASGWRVFVAHTSWYGYSNADSTIVGRVLGKEAAGIYSMAFTVASLPTQEIAAVLGRVVPGFFTRSQDDRDRLRGYFLLLTEGMSYLTLPIATGLAITARPLVEVLFGPQWLAAAMPLQILCAYVAFNTMQMLAPHVIMWTGHFKAVMWLNLFALAVLPAAFVVGVRWGLEGVAWALVVAYPFVMLPGLVLSHRLLEIRWLQYFGAMRPAAIGCFVMLLAENLVLPSIRDADGVTRLAVQVAIGAATYVGVVALMYRKRVASILTLMRGSSLA
jgi:O-antigen/teichoic acid export membrane protein